MAYIAHVDCDVIMVTTSMPVLLPRPGFESPSAQTKVLMISYGLVRCMRILFGQQILYVIPLPSHTLSLLSFHYLIVYLTSTTTY
jgi:hypothetical protein